MKKETTTMIVLAFTHDPNDPRYDQPIPHGGFPSVATAKGKPEEHGIPWTAIMRLTAKLRKQGVRYDEMSFEAEGMAFEWDNDPSGVPGMVLCKLTLFEPR